MATFFDPDDLAQLERFATAQRTRAQMAATVTPGQVQAVSAIAAAYPFMRAGVVLPLAASGATPDSAEALQVAQQEVKAKSNSGFGWHSFGDAIKGGVKRVSAVGKGFVRGTFMGLDALPQAIQGEFRNNLADDRRISFGEVAGVLNPANLDFSQTDLGVGVSQIKDSFERGTPFQGLQYGSGFFAGGDVQKDADGRPLLNEAGQPIMKGITPERIRRTRAAAPLTPDGKAQSLGRWAAASVSSPGTTQYNVLSGLVDASLVLAADPSTVFGGAVVKARKADRLFAEPGAGRVARGLERAGVQRAALVDQRPRLEVNDPDLRRVAQQSAGMVDAGTRKTVLTGRVSEWLLSDRGQAVVSKLVETTDPVELRKTFGKQIDTETLVALADAPDAQRVYDVLGPKLGVDIRQKITATEFKPFGMQQAAVKRSLGNVRMFGQLPGSSVDLLDADDAVDQLDRFLLNSKLDSTVRDDTVRRMMRAESPAQRYKVLTEAVSGITEKLINAPLSDEADNVSGLVSRKRQVAPGVARRMTSIFTDYNEDMRKYFVNEIGENVAVPGAVIDGVGTGLPSPHLFGEYINRAVPLPDARELRRATSRYATVLNLPGMDASVAGLDFITQQVFKPLVLLRAAWTVRVVGEEQIRLGASGLTSSFAHPLSHLATIVGGKESTFSLGAGRLKAELPIGRALDALPGDRVGALQTDLQGQALADSEQMIAAMSRGSMGLLDRGSIRTRNFVTYKRTDGEFAEAWSDELAQLYQDPIAKRAANGGLLPGDGVANPLPGADGIKEWFFSGTGKTFRAQLADGPGREWLLTREGADAYIDSVIDRVKVKTGGDPDLMGVVVSGKFGGERVFEPAAVRRDGNRMRNKGTQALLGDLARRAEDGLSPERVKGQQVIHSRVTNGGRFGQTADKVTENLFNTLMSRPTNYLSRSPAFRQFYYQRAEELVGFMTSEAQEAAIAAAREAKIDPAALKRMQASAARGSGDLSLEDADLVAKGFGLDKTRELLYDLHDRSQFFDITRAIFPFGEAWKEVLTTWAKIGADNPVAVRKAGLLVEGARDYDPDGDGRGFFYADPQTGEEMFGIPLLGSVAEVFTGVPVPFEATVKGANVFSQSVLPGFGPIVQIPAGKLLPDDPDFDGIRKLVIPYGATDTSGGIVESFYPAWFKKFQTADPWFIPGGRSDKQEKAFANTVTDVMRFKASTGEYGNTPDEQDRLLEDSKKAAATVLVIRGMAQFVAPSPPTTEFVSKDRNGNVLLAFKLAEEYRRLQDDEAGGGYRTATARFVDRFGEGAFLSVISKSSGGGPVTKGGLDFARDNPDLARKYGDVYGYFAPSGGDFDMAAYQRQFDSGERRIRTPEEALALADQRLGSMYVAAAKAKVGDRPTAEQKQWLRQVRDAVGQQYPGYISATTSQRDSAALIKQALAAGKDPKVQATDAGKGLRLYALARDKAFEAARAQGFESFGQAGAMLGTREWLRAVADAITDEHPDFAELYDQVLSREMTDDKVEIANV